MAPTPTALIPVLIGAVWLVAAVAATLVGLRKIAAAGRAQADLRMIAGVIEAAPTVPLLIHRDGRIEASERAGAWIGLSEAPRSLGDLIAAGFAPEDVARLEDAWLATLDSGRPMAEKIALPGTKRIFCITGKPYAAPGLSDRAVLLWLSDISDTQRETDRLALENERLGAALDGLSTLIEAAPFPMWHRGPDLALALVNSAYVQAVEARDAGEVVRRGMELIETGSEGSAAVIARRALAGGTVSTRAAPAIIAGERRMMRVTDVPVGAIGVAGFAIDAQELEEARADLGRFEQAQRDMLDRLSAGVVQFGPDHALVFYNRNFLSLFALDPDWLADKPDYDRVLERMREAQRVPESRDFPSWKAQRRAWFLSADPVEETWVLPGGTHLHAVAQPLPDGGLLLIFEDRTEHLQLASARDTLLRVRTATFDNLFEAIAVFASDGRLHLWNTRFRDVWELEEAELTRHPRVDALVQSIAPRLLEPARAGMIRELVRIATIDRQQRSGRIALKDGRHFEFAAVPLPDGNALFTLLDITASRGIEEALRDRNDALEEANSLKAAFVASMSYELRVPLTSIAGFAEMMAGGYAGPLEPKAQDYVESILIAVNRLAVLIGDALDLSQSEAGSLPLADEPVEIAPLVQEAVNIAAEAAAGAGLTIALDIAPDSGTIGGDRRRLGQVLDHLLRNAIAHTPANGRVLVRSRIAGSHGEIVVSDNGGGIPAGQLERLFDRFELKAEDDARARPKAGIGLPLARQLIEAHHGTIRVDSEAGRGTSIVIQLPLMADPEQP